MVRSIHRRRRLERTGETDDLDLAHAASSRLKLILFSLNSLESASTESKTAAGE